MGNEIAEDLGHLFEIGFNIGILTYLQQQKEQITHHLDNLYQEDLHTLHFPRVAESILKRARIISEWNRHIANQWLMFFLQKGFLAGFNFFREFHQSLCVKEQNLEIMYYQCSFCGSNSAWTNHKTEKEEWEEILTQLAPYGLDPAAVDMNFYSRQGRFLRADTLMLLRYGKKWRIFCVDLSVFSVKSASDLKDPNNIEMLRRILLNELNYVRSKSVFTNIGIDTSISSLDLAFSKGLSRYFIAFKYKDKESAKLIQAASYAYDFYTFLLAHSILKHEDDVLFNVIGHTDRSVNTLSLSKEKLKILETCASIYQRQESKEEILHERAKMIETIRLYAAQSFEQGEHFTQSVTALAKKEDGIWWIPPHRERIQGFVSPVDMLPMKHMPPTLLAQLGESDCENLQVRDAHNLLVKEALKSDITYLFLTGSPGIGKTTAVAEFLGKEHADEGFLFLYISPRKQVNLDIIRKFESANPDNGFFAITSNADAIERNHGRPTVHYRTRHRHDQFSKQGIKTRIEFIDVDEAQQQIQRKKGSRIESLRDDLLWDRGETSSGVLASVCNALYALMEDEELKQNQIIATVAVQSLKKTEGGKDTLSHLQTIFQGVLDKKGQVIPDRIERIAQRIRHIFIMIDEVTGDESGVEFLAGIKKFLNQFGLAQYGFNTKVIVADASIVDTKVIHQHLSETTFEPDKIYFHYVPKNREIAPLTQEAFHFNGKPALAINANTYPASQLSITYNVCMELRPFNQDLPVSIRDHLTEAVQGRLATDLTKLLASFPESDLSQVIVYIQDKKRLVELTQAIRKVRGTFEKKRDYLEIHASISEQDKHDIEQYSKDVRVIFMTASASRGLSFPRARYILVDIPHFEIEQNLMEIIQVIYRGRGDDAMDKQEKELLFYLSDLAMYDEEQDRQLFLLERTLNLLNILLILKTSIMTRIVGCGPIGLERFMMIPIGGKSVLAAGENLASKMERLIRELQKEYHRHYDDKRLEEVYTSLRKLLSRAKLRLTSSSTKGDQAKQPPLTTYLAMRATFSAKFANTVHDSFDKLLSWEPLEVGYITGGLLIVPFGDKSFEENYLMQLEQSLREEANENDLKKKIYSIRMNKAYPENLHSALKNAMDLIDQLNKTSPHKTQQLMMKSRYPDQFYALPLVTFMAGDVMKDYFLGLEAERETASFRDLLAAFIRALYPVSSILPIGDKYGEFPFVVFRSFSLREIRNKMFTDSYLFTSNELNILNMLLSCKF